MEYLVTFHTHFDAIQYVKFLKTKNLQGTLKPVPRKVSSSCGTCAFFTTTQAINPLDFVQEGCEEIFSREKERFIQQYKNPD